MCAQSVSVCVGECVCAVCEWVWVSECVSVCVCVTLECVCVCECVSVCVGMSECVQ